MERSRRVCEVATTLTNLGLACGKASDWSRQLDFLKRALRIEERTFLPGSPQIAVTKFHLGRALLRVRRGDQACALMEDAKRAFLAHYDASHPHVLAAQRALNRMRR